MMKFMRKAVVAVIGLFLLVLFITGGNVVFFWAIFSWIQGVVRGITGFDVQLSKALAALILAVLVMLPFGRMALAFTPLPEKNKKSYRALVFAGVAIFFLFAYLASKNTFFDPSTGKPVKYYSQLPNGEYRFYSEPGFDPLTGDSLKEVTPEVSMKSNGVWPVQNSPFDPNTGEPVKYYSKSPDGQYRFYSGPGYDPETGDSLKRVTKEVILRSKGLWPTQDYDFDPQTGEALKYYSQWPDGRYRFYSGPGYDPETGDPLKKVTKEVILKSKGLWPSEVPAVKPPSHTGRAPQPDYQEDEVAKQPPVPQPPVVQKQEETESRPVVKIEVRPDIPKAPLKGRVRFYNETGITFGIYDASGRTVLVVRPRRIMRVELAAGEYYYMGGNGYRKKLTVQEGRQANVNFLNAYRRY